MVPSNTSSIRLIVSMIVYSLIAAFIMSGFGAITPPYFYFLAKAIVSTALLLFIKGGRSWHLALTMAVFLSLGLLSRIAFLIFVGGFRFVSPSYILISEIIFWIIPTFVFLPLDAFYSKKVQTKSQ